MELGVYQIVDDNEVCHQVTLLPKPTCSCSNVIKKGECAHILSVRFANGQDITANYKMPKLSTLTKNRANGEKKSGRKLRG